MEQFNPSDKIDLGSEELRKYFLSHLNKIYCAKQHLMLQLPRLATLAGFKDLKEVIEDTTGEIRRQVERMDNIYEEFRELHYADSCKGFKCLIDDVFEDVNQEQGNRWLQDMAIIYYLQNIESLEVASFHALQLAAVKFRNELVNALLQDSFEDAKAERELLLLLSAKYLTN